MSNTFKYKNLNSIEWTLILGKGEFEVGADSESFTLQDRKCHFHANLSGSDSLISFRSDGILNSPVHIVIWETHFPATGSRVRGVNDDLLFSHDDLRGVWLTFHIIIEDELTKEKPWSFPERILEDIAEDVNKMWTDGTDHDVEIRCEDQSWRVHKNIVSIRSKVLHAMLHSDMVEGRTGVITLQDMDKETVQHFLTCLYTGKLPELTAETAKKFYEIADKYDVECIKKACAKYFIDNLTEENACDILAYADHYRDSTFKECVIFYIVYHKTFLKSDLWNDFRSNHPEIAFEVYDRMRDFFDSSISGTSQTNMVAADVDYR